MQLLWMVSKVVVSIHLGDDNSDLTPLTAYATYQMTQARKHRIDVVAYYISVPTSAPTASQTISIQVNGLPSTPTSYVK